MGIIKEVFLALTRTKKELSFKIESLFSNDSIHESFFDDLEEIFITSDISLSTSTKIIEKLKLVSKNNKEKDPKKLKEDLRSILLEIVNINNYVEEIFPCVILFVGVNGVGKTTTIGKLAYKYSKRKKSTLIVAADTFRAAAVDQLKIWSKKSKSRFISHKEGGDPSAVVYDAMKSAQAKKDDVVLIDTAGRLHNKTGLMKELDKINRTVHKICPGLKYFKYLVIDATTGQNALRQAKEFNELIDINGIIITKLDSTSKGGIAISIIDELKLPVKYIGTGESIDSLEDFDAAKFIDSII